MTQMGWDGIKVQKGVSWKLHNDPNHAFPQECAENYVKGTNIPDSSSLKVLNTCIPKK